MEESHHQGMHLLSCAAASSSSAAARFDHPSLDLQLSISSCLNKPPTSVMRKMNKFNKEAETSSCVEALKWQAAEQIRLAAMEKAYAERLRELTRREMELAQAEFARARVTWERAREEVQRAERMKTEGLCMEEKMITCHSCRHNFIP